MSELIEMDIELTPLYDDLMFLSPLSSNRAKQLCHFIGSRTIGTVVDIGCGWGELLIRLVESNQLLTGVGIDREPTLIAHGTRLADERDVADRITLLAGDGKASLPDQVDSVICIGASQIWGPPLEANAPMAYRDALQAIRSVLKKGQPAVYGEAIWSVQPTLEAAQPLSGRLDEFLLLPDLLDVAYESGFVVNRAHEATLDEWDHFEAGFTARYARWLAEHPTEHPSAVEVTNRLRAQTNAYFKGYRGILGMAYLELLAI